MATKLLSGGVEVLQLRAKGFAPPDIAALGKLLLPICRAAEVPLIINDHPQVAALLEADGVHVGQDDTSVAATRLAAPECSWVGKSTHSLTQAKEAIRESPDYIGFGPLLATPTKPDYQPIGFDEIGEIQRTSTIPVFCIGGIKLENLPEILAAGARRVVIVSGLLCASDPAAYARQCRKLLDPLPLSSVP